VIQNTGYLKEVFNQR